ncbi:ABC transporter permease [Haliangium sp.]|uniref:ABC transporter permease n=1 Tax=Haliangium sp. TaxID=2663208 RepID=UPI003D0F7C3C
MATRVGRALTPSALVRRLEAPALRGLAALVLLACCLLPLLGIGAELVVDGASAQLRATLGAPGAWLLLLRSIGLALVIAAGATAIGVPLGVVLGRSDAAGRRAALWLHLFPVSVPPFLLALGWFHLLGRHGLVGAAWTSDALFGPAGVVIVLTLAFTPVVSALVALGLQGIDASLEEAALVASRPLRVVTGILLPLGWRSIALAALIVFALALSEIGVPMFLRVRTYPAAVFTRLGGVDYAPGEAVALVLPLVLVGVLLVVIDRRLLGARSVAGFGLRSRDPAPLPLGRARAIVSGLVWLVILLSLLPLLALLWRAGGAGLWQATAWIGASVTTSVLAGVLAATVISLVGVVIGHALARAHPGAAIVDGLSLIAFMAPASVLGVGLIAVWNRPATNFVYSTTAILVLGLAARYAVIGVRALAAVFARSSPHYEEAAACAGSGYLRRLSGVVIPMHARGVVGAWLIVLVFCLRDLDTVVGFYPPGLEPLVVRIFTLEANGPEQIVAALASYQVLLTALVLVAGAVVLRRPRAAS